MDQQIRDLDVYLNDYLNYLRHIKRFSDHTIRAYGQDIRQYLEYFGGERLEMNRENIGDFITDIFIRTRKKTTISRKIYAVKSFYSYLLQKGSIVKNPFDGIDSPRADRTLPGMLTRQEMADFLDRLSEKTFLYLRNKAMFEFLYATGLRVSELVSLTREDINLSEGLLRVLGKGKKERIVPFHRRSGELLSRYLGEVSLRFGALDTHVFVNARGRGITARSVELLLQRIYREVTGTQKHVYPHLFRHSFATHLLQQGANLRIIQELLGHSNLSTTQKYTNLNYGDLLRVYRQFHPRR